MTLARPPLPRENIFDRFSIIAPVGLLVVRVCQPVPVEAHGDPISLRRKVDLGEFVLPKQDVSVPRCLAGDEVGRVVPPPLDAEASSWPPCCKTFRSGSEISSGFGAPTPEFFATEASEV
jgi:hypothetical protein